MSSNRKMSLVVVLVAVSLCFSDISMAMTGKEIVEKAQKSQVGESFRAALDIETFHGEQEGLSAFVVGDGAGRKR